MQDEILDKNPSAKLQIYVIWLPVLYSDERSAWDDSLMTDPGVIHLWDEERITGFWLAEHNYLQGYNGGLVWDAYLLFDPKAKWNLTPGPPVSQGSTVIGKGQKLKESLLPLLND